MGKHKKPFIDKKKSSTYQLIHRSQRDVLPDLNQNTNDDNDNNNNNQNTNTNYNDRMILWPKEDNLHSTTLPSTDRAVLLGTTGTTTTSRRTTTRASTQLEVDDNNDDVVDDAVNEKDDEGFDTNTQIPRNSSNALATTSASTTTTTNILSTWKEQLQQMGVLDNSNPEQYLRPITGSGTFISANNPNPHHAKMNSNNSNSSRTTSSSSSSNPPTPHTTLASTASQFSAEDAILEVNRQMESLPLTTDCMDDDIAAILFGTSTGSTHNGNNDDDEYDELDEQEYEELNDDFMFYATGMKSYPTNTSDEDVTASMRTDTELNTSNGTASATTTTTITFDFETHIRQLINTAKLGGGTSRNGSTTVQHERNNDATFFAQNWSQPLQRTSYLEEEEEEYDDDNENDDIHHDTKERYQRYCYDETSILDEDDGRSVQTTRTTYTTTTTTFGGGVVATLNPEEERALCDKFAATLAEYDNDDDNDDDDDCSDDDDENKISTNMDDLVEDHYDKHENRLLDDNYNTNNTISCSMGYGGVGRPLVGDAVVEAALDDFLLERDDDIFIHGTDRLRRTGGSGFAVLVGKQMINPKELESNALLIHQQNGDVPAVLYPEQEPAIPIDEYMALAQQTLAQPKEKPPAEEIFIDGKSYYDERQHNPWDCESILSTYSNLDNNPITIGQSSTRRRRRTNRSKDDSSVGTDNDNQHDLPNRKYQHIRLSTKTGLPLGVFDHPNVGQDHDDDFEDGDDTSTYLSVNKGMKRSKDETPAEKRIRKLVTKRERELARIQKKMTREIYHEEMRKHLPMISEDNIAGKTVFRFS
jgi:protein LTV1